jgi:tetratricopeptide (TPR) repeat protein/predicted Ser/Thr protein kinase
MRRTDGILLAYLVVRRRPASGDAVREALSRLPQKDGSSAGSVAQALIRAKLLSPQEYVLLQARVEASHHTCAGCRRVFVCVAGATPRTRRCPCGAVTKVAPVSETGARTRADVSNQARIVPDSGDAHAATANTATARLPRRIGRYQVLDRVGDGGMGIIFKVQDPASNRIVALKLLRGDASKDAQERFRRETQAIARLRHPSIIKVHDVGEDERGRQFFTMDFVEGKELGDARRTLSRPQFLEVVATVAEGLHHAHEQGIIHRDIKPQNIILEAGGAPKIADFGLARDLGRSSLTEDGDLVGTPLFMSPEQLRGDPDAIDRRTDVYALGVLLYEGLTDTLPVNAKSFPELQAKMLGERPKPPSAHRPDVPRALDGIVMRALARAPDDRYPTAAALAADLRRFLQGDLIVAPGPPLASSALRAGIRLARTMRSPAGLVALVALAIGVVGAAVFLHVQREAAAEAARVAKEEEQKALCARTLAAAEHALAQAKTHLTEGALEPAVTEARAATRLAGEAGERARALGALAPRDALASADAAGAEGLLLEALALARGDAPRREEARARYAALIAARPRDVELRLALGQLELRDGHVKDAFDHLARARALAPDRRDVRLWLAEAHLAADRPKFAEEDFTAALDADGAPATPTSTAWALAGRARARAALGALPGANEDIDAAERADPRDARVRLARAEVLQAEGREHPALQRLDQTSREHPDDATVRRACGIAWARMGDRARALEELDASIALDPSPLAWAARARLRALDGDDEGASEDLARALAFTREHDPARRTVLLVEARHERARGRIAEAIAATSQALEHGGLEASAPETVPFLVERAEARLMRSAVEDLMPAGRDLERAHALAPDDPRVARARGLLALRRHDPQLALAIINQRLERAPQDAECLVLRTRALRALEDPRAVAAEALASTAQSALVRGEPRLALPLAGPTDDALVLLLQGRRARERARALASQPARPGAAPAGAPDRLELLGRARTFGERAVALAPWLAPARMALGRALADLGAPDAALLELDRAVEVGGTEAAHRLRGELLALLDRHADATAALGRALELVAVAQDQPDSAARRRREADLRLARARSLLALSRPAEAAADLDAVIALDPKRVDAYELRAGLYRAANDVAAAEADAARVELLRRGYVAIYEQARAAAWTARSRGDHLEATRALDPAFDVVSRERDPLRLADLYRVRAFMRVRSFALPDAFVDLAAMTELTPTAFGELYDEVVAFGPGQGLDMDAILDRVRELVPEQTDVDPDFLEAFAIFGALEFEGGAPEDEVRRGLRALDRFLDGDPAHTGALLVRAVLLLGVRETAEASRCVSAALEAKPPPAFAHYLRARLLARARDREGALAALAAALEGRFTVYDAISREPDLAEVRQDARFERLLALSQGTGYLTSLERLERIARERSGPAERAEIWRNCAAASTTGLKYLKPLTELDDAAARLIAARLHLARARQAFRQGDARATVRDVAAALESSPRVLLDWQQIVEALDAIGSAADLARDVRPADGEALPTARFRPVAPVLLGVLRGARLPAADLEAALTRLDDAPRSADVYRALLRHALGDPRAALTLVRAEQGDPGLAPVLAWVEARACAALDDRETALGALARAVEGGMRGPLGRDPAFVTLQSEERFANLAIWARPDGEQGWRIR